MTPVEWYSFIRDGGVLAILCGLLWASMTGKVRWGRELESREKEMAERIALLTAERDEWKQRSLRYLDLTAQVAALTEQITNLAKRLGGPS